MKKIFKNVIKYTLISLAGFLIWIVLTGILEYNKVIFLYNPIFLIIGIIIYMLIIVLVYKYIVPKIMKLNFIEYILMGIFTIICIISGLYFKLNPTWDMGTVFEIAKEYLDYGTYSNTFYLSQFPNNIMMCVLDIMMLYPFKIIRFK